MGNTFGRLFKLTTFGESHGNSIGGIIDGCPAGLEIDFEHINLQLARRKPGQSSITSSRKESDIVEFNSGIFKGKTTGTPIGFIIKNNDVKSKDYDHLQNVFRPSHADFSYYAKYGIRDHRGGGRSSARETVCRVVAGAIAQQILIKIGVKIHAYVSKVGSVKLNKSYLEIDPDKIFSNNVRCPDLSISNKMIEQIKINKENGDTIGGQITVFAKNMKPGWGEPVFDKLHACLAKAMLSINAVHGFKYGFDGVDISNCKGSQVNDIIENSSGKTKTNFSGGIQGGISNGNDIYCKVDFKPVSTIMKNQYSSDEKGKVTLIKGKGRHDSCVVPRAVPIVESMMALTLVDHFLISKTNKI